MLLCVGNSKILEETILYAELDVFAKCLGSTLLDKARPLDVFAQRESSDRVRLDQDEVLLVRKCKVQQARCEEGLENRVKSWRADLLRAESDEESSSDAV